MNTGSPGRPFSKRLAAACAGVAAAVTPAVALACPYCAGRGGGGIAQGFVIAAFICFPFAVVWAVLRFMRSEARIAEPGAEASVFTMKETSGDRPPRVTGAARGPAAILSERKRKAWQSGFYEV